MSTLPSNNPPGRPTKRPPSVYTVMLLLAMLFMLIAVIAMYVELGRWSPDYYKTNTATPVTSMVLPVTSYDLM
ncbi:hypothetical protein [Allorhodopirellula heiligendammensis]|uniref:Uncharacterized protein n=1 Tax=Allorhodopirellula heiligendammensis TaxID=2714739 RepID=A0A5C6C6P7_9BACT|nr:hypothetical protein [Allorhodopirellula heiligendammensis]TWU19752.1 hypothetical protein Poly21_19300 [Allorhodopirellula heiligendammensis]